MENQHKHIKGYRDLTAEEIALMNEIKALGEQCGALVAKLREGILYGLENKDKPDQRWVALGQTHLQQGFMALVRSVAKPTTF